ncbi:hypothetical protein F5Y07DRAFT_362406 [Xylaria sp. FL0933]|nr:hypothetical protein F5Y07DRAFT_362406 [Xylaria sp. FL0933]
MYIPDVLRVDSVPPDPQSKVSGDEQAQQGVSVSHVITHTPTNIISTQRHHYLLAWIINIVYSVISNAAATSSPTRSLSSTSRSSLGKRAGNLSPNTTTSLVAGILVTAFIILAGIFLYAYRRSIRIRQSRKRRRRHQHRRRPSGVSKMSQGSDAVPGGGGDGAADGAAPAPDAAPPEA